MPKIQFTGRDNSISVFKVSHWKKGSSGDFAAVLRNAIKLSGISQYQLAKVTGVPQGAISIFLSGGDLRLSTFNKLACVMGLELRKNQGLVPKKTKK